MPAGKAHQVNDQFQREVPALTDEQFNELTSILAAQHDEVKALLEPIHDIASQLLADRAPKGDEPKGEKEEG